MWEEVTARAGLVAREEGRPGSFPTRSLVGLGVGPDCLLSCTQGDLAAAPCERVSPPRHHWRSPRSPSCFRLIGATCVLHLPGAHGQDLAFRWRLALLVFPAGTRAESRWRKLRSVSLRWALQAVVAGRGSE